MHVGRDPAALRLVVTGPGGADLVTVRQVDAPGESRPTGAVVDDHLVVDPDRCRATCWRECADVLAVGRSRSIGQAESDAGELRRKHSGCALVAVALSTGWLLLAAAEPTPLLVGCGGPYRWLLPSGLYGWSVAGRRLRDLRRVTAVA